MYFISDHFIVDGDDNLSPNLIGVFEGYLYSAKSFQEELQIYRKQVVDTGDWELVWCYPISTRSFCTCTDGVSAAYGIVGAKLFIATLGLVIFIYEFQK